MVPNKHLETPHYKLERLRHDDPRLDDQKASYVMAEEAARELETDTAVSRKDADVKVRPEAAVKGITPNAPAPVSQPRPARTEKITAETASTGGFFGFIKNLFSSAPKPEAQPAPSAPRGRNQNNRNGNNRNRGRRGERHDRAERQVEGAVSTEGANATREAGSGRGRQDGRNRNGNSNNRNQNNPKPENQAAITPATEAAPGTDATPSVDGEERRGRGRNRRGRGRGQRGERTESTGDAAIASVVSEATSFTGPPVGMAGASASMPIQNIAQSFGHTTAPVASNEAKERAPRAPREPREQRAPRQSNRTDHAAPAATPVTASAPAIEVIAKPMPELPKVAFQALEETPLHSVVQSAGMVWVATDTGKHQEAQSQIKAEPEILPTGRTPKAPVSLQNGPMVLVETGGQEKTV
jgi:ribonuclease E